MAIKKHVCSRLDENDKPLPVLMVVCGNCNRAWCERCDPTPSALCPWCNGAGGSSAPIGSKQRAELINIVVDGNDKAHYLN